MSKRDKSHLVRLISKVWYLSHANEIYPDWYRNLAQALSQLDEINLI